MNKEIQFNNYLKWLFCFLLFPFLGTAQSGTTSAGTSVTNANFNIAYTIGEGIVSSYIENDITLTNGIIQPLFEDPNSSINIEYGDLSVYPNPTSAIINITSEQYELNYYELLSIDGKLLGKGVINNRQIDMGKLQSGTYILKLSSPQNTFSTLIQKLNF